MSTQSSDTSQSSSPSSSTVQQAAPSALQTSEGRTTIADGVVQKIASLAAREVSGVHALGGGAARTLGALRERIPGSSQATGQGVSVEVGERQAAIDLDLVTEYGVSIAELCAGGAPQRHQLGGGHDGTGGHRGQHLGQRHSPAQR